MRYLRIIMCAVVGLSIFSTTFGQRATSLRINEVLVINQNNFIDDYGNHHAWIEFYNNSAGTVDIKGCFITNDKSNPQKYPIPKGDILTKIPPRQHVIFWADNAPDRGTFHLNFELDTLKENYIALYDANGRTLIDEVTIPAGQIGDVSYGRTPDGAESIDGISTWKQLTKVTPSTNNITLDSNAKIDGFKKQDPNGFIMTLMAMAVVFSVLTMLFVAFKIIGKISMANTKRNAQKAAQAHSDEETSHTIANGELSGEVIAAITMALEEISDENHDFENTMLTIQKVQRSYSPWSSKIYGLREWPRK